MFSIVAKTHTHSSSKTANMQTLFFVKLSANAKEPVRASPLAAGLDLFSAHDVSVPPKGKAVILTDIQLFIPPGYYGRIAPRSGLAVSKFIDVGAGVVDEDYRGNVGVVLFNFSDEAFDVRVGDRIAQLICEKICRPLVVELHRNSNVASSTERGSQGFGSTGLNTVC